LQGHLEVAFHRGRTADVPAALLPRQFNWESVDKAAR